MRRKIFIYIIISVSVLYLNSCDYLNVIPDNIATIDYAFRNRTEAEKYLFTCYSYRPTIGTISNDPAMNGCDETWQYYDPINAPFTSSYIGRGFQNSTNPYLNFWDGTQGGNNLWIGIRDCNIFLENVDKVIDLPDYLKARWIAEVKFLKAYYHYFLFKCYGPIPIVDKNLPISATPDEVKVYREPVDSVVKYITNLMAEAAKDLPDAKDIVEGTEAGRIDKLGALAMRAEVLLFAASPLFNGNKEYASLIDNRGVQLFSQSYDANKWKLAADACKAAIDSCEMQGKALYDQVDPIISNVADVFKLQTTYRQAICDRWNKELLWGNTKYDNTGLQRESQAKIMQISTDITSSDAQTWAPTLKTVETYYSSNGVPIDEDKEWKSNGWYENRYKVRPEPSSGAEKYLVKEGERTVYLHYNREPRFYASLGFDKGIYFGNGYYSFPDNVKYTDFFARGLSGKNGENNYTITGYTPKKMHSFKNGFTYNTLSYEYFPFPIMRLANLYLMYAEALNEFNGPSDEVFKYIDLVRKRAGLEGVKEAWSKYSNYPEEPNTKEGLRKIIHQERTIELAFEGKRFWDIRRWKEIQVLNDQPKGWNVKGENANDFYKVVPIAQVPVKFSIRDYFWPIQESDIDVNKNLIQNYGW